MHRIKYHHYDDSNLLDISYDLTIEFDYCEPQPASHFDPAIDGGPYDIKIVAASVTVGASGAVKIANEGDLKTMNQMLAPSFWKGNEAVRITSQRFVDEVETAIAEHLDEQDQAAKEFAAEAKFQAMRDGE
jgi:hypothetical protein